MDAFSLPHGSSYISVNAVTGGFGPGSNRRTPPGNPNDEPQIEPSTGLTATP